MSEFFFKTSVIGVVDLRLDGRPRRWSRAFGTDDDVRQAMVSQPWALYGNRTQIISVRHATECEDTQYLCGEEPKNVLCPIGRYAREDTGCSCSEW